MKKFLPIFILVFFISCKENAVTSDYEAVEAVAEVKMMVKPMSSESSFSNDEISVEQKIIKNATLKFETSDLEKTREQIQKAIVDNKASIQRENEGKENSSIYKKLTIRVPNQNFEKLIASIGKGVSFFDEKEISSQDVTTEFVDTESFKD